MKDVNYIDFTDNNTAYFTNNNEPTTVKKEQYLRTSTYEFKKFIGDGNFKKIETKDFSIEIIDIKLAKNLRIKTKSNTDFLEFSHLLSGEQKIQTNTKHGTIIYRENQSFLAYFKDFSATYQFDNNKRFKEIRIRISPKMRDFLGIEINDYNIHDVEDTFIKKTKEQTQRLLIDLIENNRGSLSKTIFMKGRIAEILANYLSSDNSKTPFCEILNTVNGSKEFIRNNLHKQLTSKTIAKEMRINESELKQIFKTTTGFSIQKYSLQQKMDKAKQLLKLTEYPIYLIAEEIGYKNATHFTNAFKKHFKMLPKAYRASVTV